MNFFGLGIVISYILATFVLWQEVKRRGLSQERVIDLLLGQTFFALIFARLVYVGLHLDIFTVDVGRILIYTRFPGLEAAGAVLGWVFGSIFLFRKNRDDAWLYADAFAPGLSIFTFGLCFTNAIYYKDPVTGSIGFGFLIMFLVLHTVAKGIDHWPEVSKLLDRHGFLGIFYLLFLFIVNFPLAFLRQDKLYYFWIFGLWLSATVFFSRYRKVFKIMIKFPAQVLVQIRKFLEDRKQKTEKQIADLKKEDPFADTDRLLDNAEQGAEAEEKAGHERIQALTHQLNMGLVEIKKALTKIKIGKYGVCEKCGKMIDTDRLAAIPMATMCVTCERKKEK